MMVFIRYFSLSVLILILLAQVKLSPLSKRSLSRFWDEGSNNGGLPGANNDEEWIGGGGSPGKRHLTARYWDEGNNNGGLLGAGDDESWLAGGSSPGKRWAPVLKARYWDESNNNGGLPGAGDDEEWLGGNGSPGKRRLADGIKARYWDEGNENGGLPGAGNDEEWLGGGSNPGKRQLGHDKLWTIGGMARYYDEGHTKYFPLEVHGGQKLENDNDGVEAIKEPINSNLQKESSGVFKSLGDFFHRVHLASSAPGK